MDAETQEHTEERFPMKSTILFFIGLLCCAPIFADTFVGGAVTANTTWSLVNSPYIVTSDVIVSGAATPVLTIEPGVVIKFNSGTALQIGTITDLGRLQAIGTSTSRISFVPNTPTPTPGFWSGVKFYEGSTGCNSHLEYADVRYAVDGIYRRSGPCITHISLENNSNSGIKNESAWLNAIVFASFVGNGAGVQNVWGVVPVTFSWWNSASGPSGYGPGTGQSVGPNVTFEPWLGAAINYDHWFNTAQFTDRTFSTTLGIYTTFNFTTTGSGDWALRMYNSSNTLLKTITGSGSSGAPIWDGKNESNLVQPPGTYRYELSSTIPGGATAAPIIGYRVIDNNLTFAISQPSANPGYFSPNGDSVQEATTIQTSSIGFDGTTWTIEFKNSGGAVVYTATSTGFTPNYAWNGRDSGGVIQPEGIYSVVITAINDLASTSNSALSVVLDNTYPQDVVSNPTQNMLVSNVHQNGSKDVSVTATIQDTNLQNWTLDYGAGSAPSSWSVLQTGTSSASNQSIYVWQTASLSNGVFTIRLQVWDRAGNRSQATSTVTIGHFDAVQNVYQINASGSQTVTYTSTVPFTLTETIIIKNRDGQVVRTLVNNVNRTAGSYNDVWNGRNDANALLPDGIYFYFATVSDAQGSMTQDLRNNWNSYWQTFYMPVQSWDPFNNVQFPISFTLAEPSYVVVLFSPTYEPWPPGIPATCDPPNYCFKGYNSMETGPHTFKWSGLDGTGAFRSDMRGAVIVAFGVSKSGVVIYGTKPVVTNATITLTPALFSPTRGSQNISFGLTTYQSQTVTVSATFTNQSSQSALRTINLSNVSPGTVNISWDGKADNGMWVAPGIYNVIVTITDPIGNVETLKTLATVRY